MSVARSPRAERIIDLPAEQIDKQMAQGAAGCRRVCVRAGGDK